MQVHRVFLWVYAHRDMKRYAFAADPQLQRKHNNIHSREHEK